MSLRSLPFLFLSSFVCAAAFAAPPAVTFEADGIYAAVPPGHRVVWGTARHYNGNHGLVTDSDNDGRVRLTGFFDDAWIVVDVETGEWTTSDEIPESALPAGSIVPGPSGKHTQIYAPNAYFASGGPLWVRPGVGAWATLYGFDTGVQHTDGYVLDATKLPAVGGGGPPTPAGFEPGDILLLLNFNGAYTGLVDPHLDDPPAPGRLEFTSSGGGAISEASILRQAVVRLGGTAGTVSVLCTISGTVEPGVDYPASAPMELVFGPGETFKTFSVQLQDDGAYNASPRSIVFTLSNPAGGATLGQRTTNTTFLIDDDPRPVLAFGNVPSSVVEGDAPWILDVPFSVTGAFRGILPVTFTANNENAQSFGATPAQTHFVAKATIPADDDRAENRAVRLTIDSPLDGFPPTHHSLAVMDDDPPRVSIEDGAGDEASYARLVLRPEWAPLETGTAYWTTVDGTAKAGEDYIAKSDAVEVSRYSEGALWVDLIDDSAAEGPETFYIEITSVFGPILPPVRTRVSVTIVDNDELPQAVILEPLTAVEGNIDKQIPLRVRLASPSTSEIELRFGPGENGTATPFKDFSVQQFVIFQPGETAKEIQVVIDGDEEIEPEETGEIVVKDKSFQTILATTTVTIIDDDTQTGPAPSILAEPAVEGDVGETLVPVRVRLASALPGKVLMALWSKHGTASADDYVRLSTPVELQAGETEKEFTLAILGDMLPESDETIVLTITYNGQDIASHTLTIVDDDAASVAGVADVNVVETTGTSAMAVFPVTLSSSPKASATIRYETVADTAGAADFAAGSGTLSFAPGQTEAEISVEVFGDATVEKDERFGVRLFDANGLTIHDDRAWATIYDDDQVVRPVLSIADVTVAETSGWTDTAFTLRLSKAPGETVKLSYTTADGSAKSPGDYEHRSGTVTFAPGETTKTIVVPIAGDAVPEETETFTVWLSNGDGVVMPDVQAVCTITDEDAVEEKRSKRRTARH